MYFLDIKIDNLKKEEILQKVKSFLTSNKQYKIYTPNPEMIVDSTTDFYFKDILNKGNLNICDGKGIQLFSKEKLNRFSGVDLMQEILKIAEQDMYSVYFLGSGDDKIIESLNSSVKKQYPNLKIAGSNKGLEINFLKIDDKNEIIFDKEKNNEIIGDIVMTAPDIIFVAFGHNKQEKWINNFIVDIPSLKIAMGVGGSFEYLSGKIKRAPKWIRKIGLEWLYRFIKQPKRIKRILKATVIFSFLILKNKFNFKKYD